MHLFTSQRSNRSHALGNLITTLTLAILGNSIPASAQAFGDPFPYFLPGNLVVSRSVYDNNANNIAVGTQLPPNCAKTVGPCAPATFNGTYPFVFNNVIPDPAFGVTSRIFLDQITPFGFLLNTLEVPNSLLRDVHTGSNQLVTSFSSKSEMALHLSTDGSVLSFMGYVAPVNTIDASNSNTPGAVDPTNPSASTSTAPSRPSIPSADSPSQRPTPTAGTTVAPPSSTTPTARTSSTPPATQATAQTPNPPT